MSATTKEEQKQELILAQKKLLETQPHLSMQDINVNIETLTPLTPEIISRQATINIGTIGHVAHGKSTLVRAISGVNVSIVGYLTLIYRLCVTIRKDSETLQSSSDMLTPNFTSAPPVPPQNATSHLGQRRRTRRNARLQGVSRTFY